jgi:hypothetical protein
VATAVIAAIPIATGASGASDETTSADTTDQATTPTTSPSETPTSPEVTASRSVYVIGPNADYPGKLTFTAPEGWEVLDNFALVTEMDGRDIFISAWDITHVYSDPCQWEGTLEEVGPTVEDLAAALQDQAMRDATVSDVALDGFTGELVAMSVPDDMDFDPSAPNSDGFNDCDRGEFRTWNGRWQQAPGQRDDVYILDVNGTRVALDVAYYPDLPQADLDEIESIVQSIHIDPPEASEPPATTATT